MRAKWRSFVCAAKNLKPLMVIDGPTGALRVLAVAPLDGGLEVRGFTADSVRPYRFLANPEDSYRAREEIVVDVVDSGVALSTTARLPRVVIGDPDAPSAAKLAEDAVKVIEAEVDRRIQMLRAIENGRQS